MYSPNLFGAMPQQMQQMQPLQQMPVGYTGMQQSSAPTLIRVNGADGAKSYQMPPNSMAALFDANDDIFYLKVSDGNGFCTTTPYRFTKIEDVPQANPDYVTRAELQKVIEELKGAMNHAE